MRRRIPWIGQMELADCGAACLAMVLAHHGKTVPLDELRDATGADRDGVDALGIIEAARRYGLRATGVAADIDALKHLPAGSVLHWEFAHFVVLERVRRGEVEIVDPMLGRRRLSLRAFGRSYTGVAVVLEPDDGFERSSVRSKGTWRYLRPLLTQSRMLARIVVSSVLIRLVALGLPLLTGLVVDQIAPRNDHHLLMVVGAAMAGVVVYDFLASLLRGHLLLQLRTVLDVRLTTSFVEHLVRLPYAFFLRRSAGDLMMRLQSNADVREILTTAALAALLDGSLATLYLILLAVLSPPLALIAVALGGLQVMVLMTSWRRNQRLMSESLQIEAKAQSYTYELLAGIETLKASGAEGRAAQRWEGLFIEEVNAAVARGRLNAAIDSVTGAVQTASPLVILVFGTLQVLDGRMSLGSMLAAAALAAGVLEPLASLVETGLDVQLTGSYMERINDVLDTAPEQDGRTVEPAPRLTGHIRAEGVSFAYGSLSPPVVNGVTIEVRPGQKIGIVGRSGAGKSTLAHLLLGLYPPSAGRIFFDGTDLEDIEVRSLRRQVGIVTQRPYLFGSTIRDNIALSDPELPLEAIMDAARLACIHDDIEAMPMGYDTMLTDGGGSLSGGQQQRIALARALVNRPAIVLLDEATSDLDTVTEQLVLDNLRSLQSTTIVIAHRLSTVVTADVIIVMQDGRIVEQGTHHDLISLDGVYRDLVAAQIGLGLTGSEAP